MANPSTVACPANTWKRVLINVTTGNVAINDSSVKYYVTHVLTGNDAPTGTANFKGIESETQVRNSVGIDVYVYAINSAGSVEVYGGSKIVGDGGLTVTPAAGVTGDVNLTKIGGVAVAAGTAAMAAALPVTLASDDTLTTEANALATASAALLTTIDEDTAAIKTATEKVVLQTLTSLADLTDVAADTHYYPTGDEFFLMDGYKDTSLSGRLIDADGTLTLTVEVTNDEAPSSDDWVQVKGYDDQAGGVVNVWTITNGTLKYAISFNEMNYRACRVKVVASGATNTVICKMRRKAL